MTNNSYEKTYGNVDLEREVIPRLLEDPKYSTNNPMFRTCIRSLNIGYGVQDAMKVLYKLYGIMLEEKNETPNYNANLIRATLYMEQELNKRLTEMLEEIKNFKISFLLKC